MYDPYADFTKQVLSNGLEVHTQYMDRPWIVMDVVVHTGAREDPKGLSGLAHFVEHLVCKNVPSLSRNKLNEFFEATGGDVSFGLTKYFATQYRFKVSNDPKVFREALRLFGMMLVTARLKNNIEQERKIIFQEFKNDFSFPEAFEWKRSSRKALLQGHPLELYVCPLGHPNDFLSAKQSDLQRFYDQYYVPANMSLVVVGGFNTDYVLSELEKSPFGVKKSGTRNSVPKPYTALVLPCVQSETVSASDYFDFKVEEADYCASWVIPTNILSQSMAVFERSLDKILFREVREKRSLAYKFGTKRYNFQDVFEYDVYAKFHTEAIPYFNKLVTECIESASTDRSLFERNISAIRREWYMVDLSGATLAKESANDLALCQYINLH